MLPRTAFFFVLIGLALCTGVAGTLTHAAEESASPYVPAPTSTEAPAQLSSINLSLQNLQGYLGRTIRRVDTQGLKRIEKDAALGKISSKVGQPLRATDIREDIRALFEVGYFDEIVVRGETSADGVILKYGFKERPVISKIEFVGNERVSTKDLEEVTKVKIWSILDVSKVREDVSLLQKHYEGKGFYLAKVRYEVRPGKNDDVVVTFKIDDYEKVEIKKITFLNNKRFSDSQLKGVLGETREGGAFSFMTGSGSFKETAFKTDLQRLTYWYLDNGYLKFKYENPIVTVSDDKRYLYITIYVDEGEQYKVRGTEFSGDLLFPKPELKENTTLTEGDLFSISKRNADIQKLSEMYQDLGYAFVNVIPKMDIRDEDLTVDIDYSFEKGNLVYFGEIAVLGNTKTHDKVIRRELRFKEGELYSGTKFRESREGVERLGFFAPGEVIFNPITPKGRDDRLDVEITVKERSTGTITLGAGYGSQQGFFLQTQIAESNLFGRGQNLSLTGQFSASDKGSRSFNLGFTDPYSFDSKWTLGFDLYYVSLPIPEKYDTRKLGFDVRAGYPLADYTTFFVTYKNEGMKVDANPLAGLDPADIDADQGVLSSVIWSVVRDRRNNRFETSAGSYQSVSLETAGLGGDKNFIKWQMNNRFYKRLFGNFVFRNSIEYGQIQGGGGKRIPPSERFFLGGPNNLKGYEIFAVGPTRERLDQTGTVPVVRREPIGGAVQMFSIFEVEHPLISEAGLKFVLFYDVGNAFTRFPTWNEFELRQSYGFGFRWFSPIGPLRFEFGYPINRKPWEDSSVFSFFIGPPF